ncbi:hypothetical protein F4819DRAFT_367105 [Hypoxylon fuscum]|nr:hypothetical protein F4819DRAFT_367105 [Hypoxylon fuscum]
MAPTRTARNIALVGASGRIGSPTLTALLSHGIHTITAIVRPESTSTFPTSVTIKKGSFTDESFLASVLAGIDILVLQLAIPVLHLQETFIRAAAAAGVPYVVPVEFGSDPHAALVAEFPPMAAKEKPRKLIENLGVSKWLAVITNPWYDYGFPPRGDWGVDIKARKAILWDGGNVKVNTTSVKRVGEATAELLALPEEQLKGYANGCFYVSSFHVTQKEILASTLRATGTSEQDWDISTPRSEDVIAACNERVGKGDMGAFMTKFFVSHFLEGKGGDYHEEVVDLEKLGLEKEDLDQVTAEAAKVVESL